MSVLKPQFPDHGSPFSREQARRRKLDAILSAAAKRFNEQGFADTRLEDVAADLGLTKTSISYYFASKEDLAEAVFREASSFLRDAVAAALDAPGDAGARILALFRAYASQLDSVARRVRGPVAALRDLDALPDAICEQIAGEISGCLAQITRLVAAWNEENGAPLGRAEPASFLILALLDWLGERGNQHRRGSDILADLDVLTDIVAGGLLAKPFGYPAPVPLNLGSNETLAIFDRAARNRMKREAFLKAGSRLFNQKGFGGTSLAEVASVLGVSRGAFYYHIEDKEQFLDQCLERSLNIIEQALSAVDESDLPPAEQLRSVLAELVYLQAAGIEPLLRPGMASVLPAPRRRRHLTRLRTIARRFGDLLAEGAETGELRPVDLGLAEDVLASIVFLNGGYTLAAAGSASSWSLFEDARSATTDYLHLLFHGIGKRQ